MLWGLNRAERLPCLKQFSVLFDVQRPHELIWGAFFSNSGDNCGNLVGDAYDHRNGGDGHHSCDSPHHDNLC